MDKETEFGYAHVQPTPEEITKHFKSGTGTVIVHGRYSTARITALRVVGERKKKLQGRIFGNERCREDVQWMDIPPDAQIDLL